MHILKDLHFWIGLAAPLLLLFWKLNPRCKGCRTLAQELGHAQGIAKHMAQQLVDVNEYKGNQLVYLQTLLDRTLVAAGVVKVQKTKEEEDREKAGLEEQERLQKIRDEGGEVYGDTH